MYFIQHKVYSDRYSQNIYFLISEQGIFLKATSQEYLRKVDDEITKFYTAKIEELDLSGSADFYNNLIEDIKQQTQKLKETRDCPYINLVYSEKLRNSCLAMKKHGYCKPYDSWQTHERQRKGFCFLIVRPEHRWKQIAANVYELARKRFPSHSKQNSNDLTWPVEIGYEKFVWFYLKQSFRNFKKSLEIKDNKPDKCLTIVVKSDIPQLNDLQKQIESLTFSYRPVKPLIQPTSKKILILSTLDIERITELVYHEFGLTNFAKELRRKMSGFLVISSIDINDQLEDLSIQGEGQKNQFCLSQKQDIFCINDKRVTTVLNRMGKRHSIVSFEGSNYIQVRIEKPLRENYEKILNIRLPCLPKYYYWYETDKNYNLLRPYISHTFRQNFAQSKIFDQMYLLYSLISVIDELHQKNIVVGSAITESLFVDENRLIIEPDQNGLKQQDCFRLKKLIDECLDEMKEEGLRNEIRGLLVESGANPFGLIEYFEDYIDSNT